MVWCRFSYVVKTGPQKLPHGEFPVSLRKNTHLRGFGAPACRTVTECGTLLILICQNRLLIWEMIYAPALYCRSSLRTIHEPVRMFPVVLVVIFLTVIIACIFYNICTFLRIFPGHIIRAYRNLRMVCRVVLSCLFH